MSTDKYDRQTRLWGEGQILICHSRIICFTSDGNACEMLKNLILAGTGYVVIVDDKLIDQSDLQENFFINKDDIGKSRAEVCLQNLLELNPDVKGSFFKTSPEEFIIDNLLQLQTFDVVIVSNKEDKFNNQIIEYAEKFSQRVVIVRNFGLINYLRLYENFHGSLQLRLPDNPVIDMRIASPWEELKNFCISFNLGEMEEIKHKHIPYIVILTQALEKFKEKNGGKLPNNSAEKAEFKAIINSMREFAEESNFDEAINFYYYANKDKLNLITPELEEIFELFNHMSIEDILKRTNVSMSNFFIVCKALQIFYNKFGTLPVVGNIPDMTSDTESYITLKKIYAKKGMEDRETMYKIVQEILQKISDKDLGLKKEQIESTITSEDVNYLDIICKNWPQVSLLHYSSIKEEEIGTHYNDNDIDEPHHKTNFIWYLLIKASDLFHKKHARYPGEHIPHDKFQEDVPLLFDALKEYLNTNNKLEKLPFDLSEVNEAYVFEFCRLSNSKIVPAISIIASIASQEIIKLITYQFKSVNNTVIFDGINTTISTFKF